MQEIGLDVGKLKYDILKESLQATMDIAINIETMIKELPLTLNNDVRNGIISGYNTCSSRLTNVSKSPLINKTGFVTENDMMNVLNLVGEIVEISTLLDSIQQVIRLNIGESKDTVKSLMVEDDSQVIDNNNKVNNENKSNEKVENGK